MKLVSDLYNQAASFKKNENGSILPITAIILSTLVLVTGATIDYTRYANARTVMTSALDAAVLDAGVRLGRGQPVDEEFEEDFNEFFQANITGRGGTAREFNILNFSANEETGEVSATAEVILDTTLTRVAGFEEMNAISTSGGIFEQNDTEVTIMLDVTGSMGESITPGGVDKIDILKGAASDAVTSLLGENGDRRGVRVGLVPYAASVNAGRRYAPLATRGNRDVASANGSFSIDNRETRGCVTERSGPTATTGVSPRVAPVGSHRLAVNENRNTRGNCPRTAIRPLTNQKNALLADIDGLRVGGSTSGHLGIAWSYYMLEEQWIDLWDTEDEPAPYSDSVNKVAILMTDGEFNTVYTGIENPGSGLLGSENVARSEQLSVDLCSDMKAVKNGNPGITVYSIAFAAPASAEAILRACATPDSGDRTFFFSASSGQELNDAFNEIVDDITSLRLTQ